MACDYHDILTKHIVLQQIVYVWMSDKRAEHSNRVAITAYELAKQYGIDTEQAWLVGMAHDLCREKSSECLLSQVHASRYSVESYEYEHPVLLHGKAATAVLERYYPLSQYAYDAIAHHTLGCAYPSDLQKIIYVADALEPHRNIVDALKRSRLLMKDLNQQVQAVIAYIEKTFGVLHPVTREMYDTISCNTIQ